MDDQPAFGDMLKRARQAAGFTQEALAARAGVSARAISDLERGVKHVPRRDTVRLLVAALPLSPQERASFEAAARRRSDYASRGAGRARPGSSPQYSSCRPTPRADPTRPTRRR